MKALEIIYGVGLLARAARHLKNQDDKALPRSARQALADATEALERTAYSLANARLKT